MAGGMAGSVAIIRKIVRRIVRTLLMGVQRHEICAAGRVSAQQSASESGR